MPSESRLTRNMCPKSAVRGRTKSRGSVSARSSKCPVSPAFLEALGLLPHDRIKDITSKQNKTTQVGDLTEGDEEVLPRSPVRSQKSLLYQRSREGEPGHRNIFEAMEGLGDARDSDNDSVSSKSDLEESGVRMAKSGSFLKIDLSSPLGARVKSHVHKLQAEDSDSEERKPHEDYCSTHTETPDAKLRARQNPFPVTYRNRRKALQDCHLYKFTKREKREFRIQMKTGLTKASRILKRQMKTSRVAMENLSDEKIEEKIEEIRRKHRQMVDLTNLCQYSAFSSSTPVALWRRTENNNSRVPEATKYPHLLSLPLALRQQQQKQRLQQLLLNGGKNFSTQALCHLLTMPADASTLQQNRAAQIVSQLYRPQKHRPNIIRQTPTRRHDADVIDISSSDDEEDVGKRSNKIHAAAKIGMSPVPNAVKSHINEAAVMFKCNLCGSEILFTQSTTRFIRDHFANIHGVPNVDILQHRDKNNQLVFSIVESASRTQPQPAIVGNNAHAQPTRPLSARKSPSIYRRPHPSNGASFLLKQTSWLHKQKPHSAASQEVICID